MNAIRNVFASLGTALVFPRVWLSLWSVVTVAAVLAVLPSFRLTNELLQHHPGASFNRLDQSLDADLARLYPEIAVPTLPGALFLIVVGAFLAGGILTRVGRGAARFTYGGFMSDCGRLFARNLRVLLGVVVVAALVFWGADAVDRWLREDLLYGKDPGAIALPLLVFDVRWAHVLEALSYFWGLVFLGLVFTSKVAMAHLATGDRRSAFAAWFVAIGKVLRRPFRMALSVVLLAVIWLAGAHLIGIPTAWLLEGEGNLVAGALVGQVSVMFGSVVSVAFVLAARRFFEGEAAVLETPVEPLVDVDRRRRDKAATA